MNEYLSNILFTFLVVAIGALFFFLCSKITMKEYLIAVFGTTVILSPIFIWDSNRFIELRQNGECMNAVISDFYYSGRRANIPRLNYYYFVDGKKYKGWGRWHPKSDKLSIGDTIVIVYNKKKPDSKSTTKRDIDDGEFLRFQSFIGDTSKTATFVCPQGEIK